MSEIDDIADMKLNELLQQVDWGDLDIVESRIDQRQDMSKKQLGVALAPVGDTLSTSGMIPHDGKCRELYSDAVIPGPVFSFPRMGVVIMLLDHAH